MSTRRPKSVLDQDRYTAELSTGQLVIGVCILLMFGLGCFLLGVLIGKFDPTLKPGETPPVASAAGGASAPEVKVAEITVSSAPLSPTASPAAPTLEPENRVPPRTLNGDSERPASTAEETVAQAAAAAPVTALAAPDASAAPEQSVGASVEAAAEKNRVVPPAAAPQVAEAPAAETEVKKASAEEPAAAWKGYGVQVIAVAKDRADAARKVLESKSSYRARVLPHTRNSLYRVVVGPFADQAAAGRAREDLRARYGYKDAFILVLP